jgi:hypothetical protein
MARLYARSGGVWVAQTLELRCSLEFDGELQWDGLIEVKLMVSWVIAGIDGGE